MTDESMQSGSVGESLHERDRRAHQRDLVGERVADVDVEHVGAARDLLRDVDLELREVARLELRLERLAAGRVDPLADDAERLVRADDDRPRRRLDDCIHSSPSRSFGMPSRWQRRAMPASRRKLIRCRPATPGSERACSASSHATSKHSASGSAARSQRSIDRGRDLDAGHVLVDVAQRVRRADEADRREERALLGEPLRRPPRA